MLSYFALNNLHFGVPRQVKADGLMMDVDRYHSQIVSLNNDMQKFIA